MIRLADMTPEAVAASRARRPRAFSAPPLRLLVSWTGGLSLAALLIGSLIQFDVSPARLWTGLTRLGHVLGFMLPPYVWRTWEAFLEPVTAIGETLAMAFLGTLIAGILALPLSFLGAKNVLNSEAARFFFRRSFDLMRTIETIVLALIFIRAFGLGPLAGIFAIAIGDLGALAKLFAEAIENVDRRPIEGVNAAGAGRIQTLRLAVLPQVLPVMLSNLLYFFESNVRTGTVLGVVGAGGIGFLIYDRIGANNWDEVMSIVLLILVTVSAIDLGSAALRHRLIGGGARRRV
jgi:phosphonate transport system permease protein